MIKTDDDPANVRAAIEAKANELYSSNVIVSRYMASVEEIITIRELKAALVELVSEGKTGEVVSEVRIQSAVEFNFDADEVGWSAD